MKVLFFLVHPAHFHLFKNVIKKLKSDNIEPFVIIRPKESLESLCNEAGFDYIKVSDGIRKNKKLSMLVDILKRDFHAYQIIKKIKPDLLIGSSVEICHVGKFLGIPSVITHEDDYDNMKFFSYSAFPFATNILSPLGCRQGRWEKKCIHYPGYHELSYLHPNNYVPDPKVSKVLGTQTYFLLRFSQFNAHHDFGASGISDSLAKRIITILKPYGKVFISSERPLSDDLERYRITLPASSIHDVLYSSKMLIGDSQSMTVEAAVLGVPAIRFNKFAEDYSIAVLDELEKKYELAIGINNRNPARLIKRIEELMAVQNLKEIWHERRVKMLTEKIDTCNYLCDFIKNFNNSSKIQNSKV